MINSRILIVFLLPFVAVFAQETIDFDSLAIENSPDYYWGKGRSSQVEKAKEDARSSLSESIVTFLYQSKEIQTKTEVSGTGVITEAQYHNTVTKRFSALHLNDLEIKVFPIKGGGYAVWAYISKANWEKSLKELALKVENLLIDANGELSKQNINGALPLLYKAYLVCVTSPKSLYPVKPELTNGQSLSAYLQNAITNIFSVVTIQVQKPQSIPGEETELNVPLILDYKGTPLSSAVVIVEKQKEVEVTDGKATIVLGSPKFIKEDMVIFLKVKLSNLDYLEEIDRKYSFSVKRSISVDFSSVVKLYIDGKIGKNVLTLTLFSEYLNVVDVSWVISNGDKNKATLFKTDFGSTDRLEVELKVNNSNDLIRKKVFYGSDYKGPIDKETIKVDTANKVEFKVTPDTEKVVVKKDSVRVVVTEPFTNKSDAILPALSATKSSIENFKQLIYSYKQQGLVIIAKKAEFPNPDICHIAVFDETNKTVVAILAPVVGGKRKDLFSGENIENIKEKYIGKMPFWFQIL